MVRLVDVAAVLLLRIITSLAQSVAAEEEFSDLTFYATAPIDSIVIC